MWIIFQQKKLRVCIKDCSQGKIESNYTGLEMSTEKPSGFLLLTPIQRTLQITVFQRTLTHREPLIGYCLRNRMNKFEAKGLSIILNKRKELRHKRNIFSLWFKMRHSQRGNFKSFNICNF